MFDKILYINLARRPDRNQNAITQLKKVNLLDKAERIDAVDGKQLDIASLSSDLITDHGRTYALSNRYIKSERLTPGAIGCALSHLRAYQKIINDKIPVTLILEDDVTCVDDFNDKMKLYMQYIPDDFDIVYLGYHFCRMGSRINKYFSRTKKVSGTFGYIVSNKGAVRLAAIFPISLQIDNELGHHLDKMNAYAVNPSDRIILSDEEASFSKFGTDIQHQSHIDVLNIVLIVILMIIVVVLVIYLIYRLCKK